MNSTHFKVGYRPHDYVPLSCNYSWRRILSLIRRINKHEPSNAGQSEEEVVGVTLNPRDHQEGAREG